MSQDAENKSDLKSTLMGYGIETLFLRIQSNSQYSQLKGCIINYHEEIMDKYFDDPRNGVYYISEFINFALSSNINIYDRPRWKGMIDGWYTSFQEKTALTPSNISRDNVVKLFAYKPDVDWEMVVYNYIDSNQASRYSKGLWIAVEKLIEKDKSKFESIVDKYVFSSDSPPPYPVRGDMYKYYIGAGLLTKKTARKIRSEASSEASVLGVRQLLDSSEIYPNFEELILQFCDSKHADVIALLANRLPKHLLISVVATEFSWIKKTIDRRMQENV